MYPHITTGLDTPPFTLSSYAAAAEFAAVALGGKIYAMGGYDGNNRLKSMEVFDPSTNQWANGQDMSTARGE